MIQTGSFINSKGHKLHTISYTAAHPKAIVLFIHGYTEHTGRYAWVAEKLNHAGISFHSYDQRGYGLSEGARAYVDSFDEYLEDFDYFYKQTDTKELPVFIMGQSMGSLIAVKYFMQHPGLPVRGLISTSGALKISEHISPFLRKISGILSAIVPGLATLKLDAEALSRDPEVVRDYMNDPLVYHGGAKSRTGHEMLKAMKQVQEQAEKLTYPVIFLHGSSDRLADPHGSQHMYDNCSSQDKTIKIYEGWYHELFREPQKEKVMQDITGWIQSRL